MQLDINKYNQIEFEEEFKKSDLYQILKQDFDILGFDYHYINDTGITFRQLAGDQNRKTKFSVIPFYYLKFLTDANPSKIYDLGCGWNIFKKYIPNIIGIEAENIQNIFSEDIRDIVDDDYIKNHQNYFESVFSINSLHFYPISKIRQRVLDFASMIKDNGCGFLSLNCLSMVEADDEKFQFLMRLINLQAYLLKIEHNVDYLEQYIRTELDNFPLKIENNIDYLEQYIRIELDNLPFELKIFEVDLTVIDNQMDGNIRMVIKK
jgi:hypothetical protein